jgi:hypothetical protein
MTSLKFALPMFVFLIIASQVKGADADAKAETWTGTLAAAPAGAKDGVVAALKVKDGDKDVVVSLWADGDVAKDLKDWAAKGAKAKITGTKVDAANVKVTKVEKAE